MTNCNLKLTVVIVQKCTFLLSNSKNIQLTALTNALRHNQ